MEYPYYILLDNNGKIVEENKFNSPEEQIPVIALAKTMGYETKKVPCPRYGEVKAYHVDVIAAFKKTYL